MASKREMPALVGSSLWRTPTLMLMAALTLIAYAPAQPAPPAPAASKDGTQVSAEQTLTRARALRKARQYADMLAPLEAYLASDPRNTVVRLEYARTLAVLRRFPEAAREYRRVLETEPQNPAALVGLAKIASWQGQNQLALETYNRVLARRPGFYDALVGKAFVLLWMGRQEEARALFREAQRRHPDDLEVKQALGALDAPTSPPAPADAAAQDSGAAADDSQGPAASDTSESAPAEAANAAMTPSPVTTTTPVPQGPDAAASGATAKGWSGGELKQEAIAVSASLPSSPPAPSQSQKSPARLRSREVREQAGMRTAGVPHAANLAAAPKDPPSPLRIPPASAVLGMVAVVVGALVYRTYRVRQHSATLAMRRTFELPPASPVPPPRPAVVYAGKGGPLAGRVLVVHPQQAVRDFAHTVLAGAGAEVLALGRGEDAMVRLERAQYDAIVISDQLPEGWTGREIYRWLERNQPGAERKLVLALAGETDEELQVFLEESRALTISTPFGVSDLLAMTRLAIARSRAQA